ncbi:DHH family phosphoesterase [Congregibacter variabilis]|uniref:DHH family phosphoesterase n=1 Tax=Congregibacter variabilis TaxID=3081200 RepID=A0ABZ0I8S2_9GAMM|nr:DHH family phosphoesterase [Congregibacter sp. IMCC43200]
MKNFDVFNGDADGICALLQLRQAMPLDAELLTGVKRDIQLLDRVAPEGVGRVTVLDVSLDKNRQPLEALLQAGAHLFYCDHHFAGDIPEHPNLEALINTSPDVCTSLLVNGHLRGAFAHWAVVGAFGDNLDESAMAVARTLDLDADTVDLYKRLGTYVNYNGYGAVLEDLHFHPAELYQLMLGYTEPRSFVKDAVSSFERLEQGYEGDMSSAADLLPEWESKSAALFVLPDASWARRVSGVYGNALANATPARAHAVLTRKSHGGYLVSVRAPLEDKRDADTLCRQFETGGGRAAAAGINELPSDQLSTFIDAFSAIYR